MTLREEHRLKVFENRVLRRVFGPKRDEVTGKWRKLHNKELNDLYSLPNIVRVVKSRRMRWAGAPAAFTCYSFLLQAESNPGPQCDRKDYVTEKFQ
jgi:hypothetical protein